MNDRGNRNRRKTDLVYFPRGPPSKRTLRLKVFESGEFRRGKIFLRTSGEERNIIESGMIVFVKSKGNNCKFPISFTVKLEFRDIQENLRKVYQRGFQQFSNHYCRFQADLWNFREWLLGSSRVSRKCSGICEFF